MPNLKAEALELLTMCPAQVGRWCGFTRLTDTLHGGWMRQMITGHEDLTILAHRGSCKTTCLTVAIASLLCVQPEKSILFLRKTDSDVTEVLRQVKQLLQHEAFQTLTEALYDTPVQVLRSTGSELVTDCYASPRGAVQLLGQGIGGSLTGKHADVIFTDDIVNLQDRLSESERAYTRSIYQELQNIRNPGGRIINTGTPWHPEDAVSLMPGVQRYDCYTTGLLSPAQLDQLRASMAPSLFAANYELQHIASEGALLQTPPQFFEDALLLRDGFAHVDAAYGGGDYTAFTAGKRVGGQLLLFGRLWHAHVSDVLPQLQQLCEQLMVSPIYCETNADKGYLTRELRSRGLPVRPYAEHMAKPVKISGYLRRYWPDVRLHRDTDAAYLRQLMDYTDRAAHDDAPDSAACMLRLLERAQR